MDRSLLQAALGAKAPRCRAPQIGCLLEPSIAVWHAQSFAIERAEWYNT